MHKYANLGDTVCFWFGANTTAGSGGDGASPAARVRLAGAAANAAPVLSPTPTLLSHANYPDGCYEVAVAATVGNGFAAGNEYAVFCTLAIDSQNPTGFLGSFTLDLQDVNAREVSDSSAAADAVEANIANLNAQVTSRSSHSAAEVWSVGTRTLTSFGTLVSDVASAVWGAATRTLTSFGSLASDCASAVWGATSRTLSSFGTLASDVATAVWGASTRTLSSFGTLVADMVAAVFAKTGLTAGGVVTFGGIVRALYAYARGKINKAGDAYSYKDDDDTTTVFTNTAGTNERTPS
jgi:hypothetical protein